MDSSRREALARQLLALCGADQAEALVTSHAGGLTRFTRDAVHQNVAESDVAVQVRAMLGKRTGVAKTNVLGEPSLRAAVHRALAMARLAPEDPNQPQLPFVSPAPASPPGAYAAATAQATPHLRAQMTQAIFSVADRFGYWPAGFVTTGSTGVSLANSSGVTASFDGTEAAVNVKVNAPDSSGYGEGYACGVTELDAQDIGEAAAQKARDSARPQPIEPGAWTVILEPPAFGELLSYLTDHFSAQTYDEGASFLSDGLERAYLGDNVTIGDDYAHPLAPGMPFDYEGQATQRLTLVDGGIARAIVTDSYWAHKLERPNTGHALPAPNSWGPQATHLVVSPGSKPIAELIAQTARGLLISRFWYIRTVDRRRAIVTGMTRDGTFLIQRGRITGSVCNLRFNQSIIEALRRCEFANALHRTGGPGYSMVVPAAKIEGFMFSSATAF